MRGQIYFCFAREDESAAGKIMRAVAAHPWVALNLTLLACENKGPGGRALSNLIPEMAAVIVAVSARSKECPLIGETIQLARSLSKPLIAACLDFIDPQKIWGAGTSPGHEIRSAEVRTEGGIQLLAELLVEICSADEVAELVQQIMGSKFSPECRVTLQRCDLKPTELFSFGTILHASDDAVGRAFDGCFQVKLKQTQIGDEGRSPQPWLLRRAERRKLPPWLLREPPNRKSQRTRPEQSSGSKRRVLRSVAPAGRQRMVGSGYSGDRNRWYKVDAAARETLPGAMLMVLDAVRFSVTGPGGMQADHSHLVEVWAHSALQREEVRRRAQEHAGSARIDVQEKGPVLLGCGTVLTVRLRVNGLRVEPGYDTILWLGEIANARFVVTVPPTANPGDTFSGQAKIHAFGGVLAVVSFVLRVEAAPLATDLLGSGGKTNCKRAFASYASEDNAAVLGRIQGMKKALPDLDVFYAGASLRSGDLWRKRLREEILARDVFYLFWSKAAKRSHWVEWEWRLALSQRGIDYIDPVPLASPQQVPPPPELADELHFGDWMLAYMNPKDAQ